MAKEVTKSTGNGLAVAEFEDLAGLGFEEAKSEDMAIPFLRILAQLSPQVNKRDGAYVEGAEAGMIYNTVSNEVFKGEDGITVIPCYYSRRYVEWKPRAEGGGYVNSYHPDDTVVTSTVRNERGEGIEDSEITEIYDNNTRSTLNNMLNADLGYQNGLKDLQPSDIAQNNNTNRNVNKI